jgi:hypothetical protein
MADGERKQPLTAENGLTYVNNPTALHLRAMNMLYEGLKQNSTLVNVSSSVVDTVQFGYMAGMTALAMELTGKNAPKTGPTETKPGKARTPGSRQRRKAQ